MRKVVHDQLHVLPSLEVAGAWPLCMNLPRTCRPHAGVVKLANQLSGNREPQGHMRCHFRQLNRAAAGRQLGQKGKLGPHGPVDLVHALC